MSTNYKQIDPFNATLPFFTHFTKNICAIFVPLRYKKAFIYSVVDVITWNA